MRRSTNEIYRKQLTTETFSIRFNFRYPYPSLFIPPHPLSSHPPHPAPPLIHSTTHNTISSTFLQLLQIFVDLVEEFAEVYCIVD